MVGYAIYYFVRKNFSVAMPGMTAEFGISNTSFGVIIALGSLIYGFSRFANGFVVEKRSPKVVMAVGLLLCALANFGFAFGADLSYLITGADEGPQFVNMLILLMGVTIILNQYFQGMGYPPCAKILPSWIHPSQLATKMSIWNTSHSIGAFCAVIVCGAVMTHLGLDMSSDAGIVERITGNLSSSIKGWDSMTMEAQSAKVMSYASHYGAWKYCFLIPAFVAVFGAIWTLLLVKNNPSEVSLEEIVDTKTGKEGLQDDKNVNAAFRKHMVYKNRWVWTLAIANIFVYILRMGVLDWGPKFLTEDRGMDINAAAWSVAVFELTALVGTIFAGWATDHLFKGKAHRMCLVSMIGSCVFFGLFALLKNVPVVMSVVLLAMGGFCIYGPQALIGIGAANQATKEASATANGIAGVFGYIGSAVAALAIGLIADNFGWNMVFVTFIVVGLIGSAVFLTMWNAPRDGYDRSKEFMKDYSNETK